MAKWGEGDPRWIVEERPDATNVNNWHWTEKNASAWSKEKIKTLLLALNLEVPDLGTVTFSEVECKGEATANNRKGKLIFFYEWVVDFKWNGVTNDNENAAEGTINIPNLSEENEPHEIDVNVTIKSGGSTAEKFKDYLRAKGTEEIQKVVEKYLETLRKEYSADLILPTKGSTINNTTVKSTTISQTKSNAQLSSTTNSVQDLNLNGCKITTTDISLQQTFKCRAQDIFNAFVMREMLVAFTRSEVKIDPVKGGKFELFGGSISGEFITIESPLKIVKKWRSKSWPSGHYSTVIIEFNEKEDCTELSLQQTGVPTTDLERTKQGWKFYYWESIKRTFGFGAVLM